MFLNSAKTQMFAIVLPFFICLSCLPIHAAQQENRIKMLAEDSFAFHAFYQLQAASLPSKLLVEVVHEYNIKSGSCSESPWLPHMRCLELRFTLNGTPNRVKIWKAAAEKEQYKISGLAACTASIWQPAIKKLAKNLAVLCRGKQKLQTRKQPKLKIVPIHITPLANRTLRTITKLFIHSSSNPRKPVSVIVDVQSEPYKGEKMVVATATLCTKNPGLMKKEEATIKFVHTKHGLQEISKERMRRSSMWYPWVKKIVEQSVQRYFKFKQIHNVAAKTVKVKKHKKNNVDYIYID